MDTDSTSSGGPRAETSSKHVSTVADEPDEETSSRRRLHEVVTQLQGDMKEGSSQDELTRKALDGIFQTLPSPSQTATKSVDSAVAGTTFQGASAVSPLPGENGGEIIPSIVDTIGVGGSDGAVCKVKPGTETNSSVDSFESLPSMLDRLQAKARASDQRPEQGSSNEANSTEFLSTLTATKLQIMRTRLESIRHGRVSWAVLPLLLRARESGIPLSTGIFNAGLAAYKTTPNKYPDALRVLELMRKSDCPEARPDVASYNIVMRVCGDAGNWRMVLEVSDQALTSSVGDYGRSRVLVERV